MHNELFHPKEPSMSPFKIYVYIGTHDNDEFLGDAPLEDIAKQIAMSHGPSGANSEYLFRLADALRSLGLNTVDDHHLFDLNEKVKDILKNNKQLFPDHSGTHSNENRRQNDNDIEVVNNSNS